MEAQDALKSLGLEDNILYLQVLHHRAECHISKSEHLEAQYLYQEMVNKTSPTRSSWYHANALCTMAQLGILMAGNVTEIVANINAADAVYSALGRPENAVCSWLAAEVYLYRGDIINARAAFIGVLSRSGWMPPDIRQLCLAALSNAKNRMHGPSDTLNWAVVSLALSQKMNNLLATSHALRYLADLYTILGDEEVALNLYYASLQAGTTMDVHRLRAECMVGIGDILIQRGDVIQAKEMWEGAHPLFVRSSRMKDAAAVQKRLERLSSATISPSVAPVSPDPEPDSVDSSLDTLAFLKAPSHPPNSDIRSAMGLGVSTDGAIKLSLLDRR
jgi:tetratricopeptide (TPR) repeat protein